MDLLALSCSLVLVEAGAKAVGTLTAQRQFWGVENNGFATALMGTFGSRGQIGQCCRHGMAPMNVVSEGFKGKCYKQERVSKSFATGICHRVVVSQSCLFVDAFYATIKCGESIILKCPNTNLGVLHTMVPSHRCENGVELILLAFLSVIGMGTLEPPTNKEICISLKILSSSDSNLFIYLSTVENSP
jgi:hypothetical protein